MNHENVDSRRRELHDRTPSALQRKGINWPSAAHSGPAPGARIGNPLGALGTPRAAAADHQLVFKVRPVMLPVGGMLDFAISERKRGLRPIGITRVALNSSGIGERVCVNGYRNKHIN